MNRDMRRAFDLDGFECRANIVELRFRHDEFALHIDIATLTRLTSSIKHGFHSIEGGNCLQNIPTIWDSIFI